MKSMVFVLLVLAAPFPLAAQGSLPVPHEPEELRIALAAGDTLAVTVAGEGETIVLVPGMLGGAFGFRHLVRLLSGDGMQVVVVEPLGTGESARPRHADYTLEAQAVRVAAVLDSLQIDAASFVCHSVGASICMRLALREPQRVRAIVSLNGGPDERAATGGVKGALRLAPLLRLFGGERIARNKVRDGLRGSAADPAWVTEEVVRGYTAPYRDLTGALHTLDAMSEAREPVALRSRLNELRVPMLLLIGTGGKRDATASENVALMMDSIPTLHVERLPEAGQYMQEEQPEAVAAAVREFLAALPSLESR